MELQAKYEGRSKCVDVTRNDDGTFTFTVIATAGRGNTEVKLTAKPHFEFDLHVFEDPQIKNQRGEVVLKEVPFRLEIAGHIAVRRDGIYFTQEPVSSPHGRGRDLQGRDLQSEGQ